MPPEIILVLLALMAIAAIALGVSRARRRRPRDRRALPGERQLAWLGDRIDDSVGMWALRSLLGRADPGDHEAGDEPSPTARTPNSSERATANMPTLRERAYGRMPASGAQPGRWLIADMHLREQHAPQAHRQDDPRGRLWRDATLVLLAFTAVAAVVISVQPPGFLGGVGGVTASPEGSLPLVAVSAGVEPFDSRGPTPTAGTRPAVKPTVTRIPSFTPSPAAVGSSRPAPRSTARSTPRPTRSPTTPIVRPTTTPAPVPPVAIITVSLVATCTADSPATYSFSGAASTEATSYAWAFSSGIAGSTAAAVTRDFPGSTAGTTYTITLTVENAVGASDTDSTEITAICS